MSRGDTAPDPGDVSPRLGNVHSTITLLLTQTPERGSYGLPGGHSGECLQNTFLGVPLVLVSKSQDAPAPRDILLGETSRALCLRISVLRRSLRGRFFQENVSGSRTVPGLLSWKSEAPRTSVFPGHRPRESLAADLTLVPGSGFLNLDPGTFLFAQTVSWYSSKRPGDHGS